MLCQLRVSNLGVLEDAMIEPSDGLTVITGETGAGKTLLLGGLRLMLGGKPDTSVVGPAGDSAQADGLFESGEAELGVTRVVPKEGRSSAYLEGSLVSAATLAERIGGLVEIVGQHDHLALRRPAQVLVLIDGALDPDGLADLAAYREAWSSLQALRDRQAELGGNEMALRQELDLVRFQVTELDAASLEPGEDTRLEAEAARHDNVEAIRELLAEVLGLTERLSDGAGEVVARLRKLAALDPGCGDLASQAEALAADLADLATGARRKSESVEDDPRRAEEVARRLTLIGDLKRKYGSNLQEVISFDGTARRRLEELEGLLAAAGRISDDLNTARASVEEMGGRLSASRSTAAGRIVETTKAHLADLGLGRARIEVRVEEIEPAAGGVDRVALLFSSDDRLEPGPISSVASGGELSRLVLALRLATRSADSATLVFDEVDAGVGGATALAMGRKLSQLAEGDQVLCVTHLPQLAAFADTHYVVERDDKGARVRLVTGEGRLEEISRMLAGMPGSEASQSAAAELLSTAAG